MAYTTVIALETSDGWVAALAEYESEEIYDELEAAYGGELPQGAEDRIVATCHHRHRSAEGCIRCFAKLEKHQQSRGGI